MHPISKLLTTAIIILALLSAGCTDTGGGSVQSPMPTATNTATRTPTPAPVTHWYDGKPDFEEATVITLFGDDLYGVKASAYGDGNYNMFDIDNGETILKHLEYPNFDPYDDLQPEQARALETEYGNMVSLTMEQIDTDSDGALDKVAVRYEGSIGTFTYEQEYVSIWKTPQAYLKVFIDGNWNELKPLLEQKGYI